MAEEPVRWFSPNDARPFGPDYEASILPEVQEFYGAKMNLFYSDREFRIAFGTAYGHPDPAEKDGTLVEPRYKLAVYMPVQTARELHFQLGHALKILDDAPPEDKIVA